MSKFLHYLNHKIDSFFTAPEVNAAGRMGIFRILYSLFYLWFLSSSFAIKFSVLPSSFFNRILLTEPFPKPLPSSLLVSVESILVAFLVFLLIGYKTKISTGFVLFFGCFLESLYGSVYLRHSTTILVFLIPFFMFIFEGWGDTYSLDAYLQKKKHIFIDPSNSSWEYFLPTKCLLIVLSMLFLLSGIYKLMSETWLFDSDLLSNHVLLRNIKSTIYDLPLNFLAPWIAKTSLIHNFLRFFTIFFELFFFVALFNNKLRPIVLSTALIFHAVNAIWFVVTFTPVLIIYGLFVDWQALLNFLLPKQNYELEFLSSRRLIVATIALAVATAILWNSQLDVRGIFNLGGLLNWHTIWYPILPLSLIWLIVSLFSFLLPIKRQLT